VPVIPLPSRSLAHSFLPSLCCSLHILLSPDSKFPQATHAFHKVSVAYDVLSDPASKQVNPSRPASHEFSVNNPGTTAGTEETLRTVIVSIFNDGNLEMVLTLLRRSLSIVWSSKIMIFLACLGGINDLSPSLRLGDDGIGSIFLTL